MIKKNQQKTNNAAQRVEAGGGQTTIVFSSQIKWLGNTLAMAKRKYIKVLRQIALVTVLFLAIRFFLYTGIHLKTFYNKIAFYKFPVKLHFSCIIIKPLN